ncbi:hypothetical protein [Streptomyces sp. AMCC400023]|uniref:hypothetical protein n=1 Tax=Streptomyces sp. AMCC400023 TaxID=2056258 RepID=UPI001F44EF29|nr:hypothetical protein [Streptomyces sp. AMCC400023]UJV42947.1 hypothetical protein CVT30_26670 [Streptomyces sp. AMCC400023]
MTRQIDTKTPNRYATPPATVEACQADRANRPGSEDRTPSQVDSLNQAAAVVQRGLVAGQVTR